MPRTYGATFALEKPSMQIETAHLGEIEIPDNRIIDFSEGLIGLPNLTRFALLDDKERAPFQWLQSINEPSLTFVVVDPKLLTDFQVDSSLFPARFLGADDFSHLEFLALITIPDDPREMTANLKGPIVYNPSTRQAAQVVMDDERYPLQYRILPDLAIS